MEKWISKERQTVLAAACKWAEEISEKKALNVFPHSDRWKNVGTYQSLVVLQMHPLWSDLCASKGDTLLYLTTIPTDRYGKIQKRARITQ